MTITPTPVPVALITHVNYKEGDDDSSLDGSLVAFIVIGSVVIVVLIIALALFMRKYQQRRRSKPNTVLPPAMPMPFAAPPVPVSTYAPGMMGFPPAVPAQGEAPRVSLPPVRVVEQGQQAPVMASSPAPPMRGEMGGPMGGMTMGISPMDSSVQSTPPMPEI